METLFQDLRYAVRILTGKPGFALIAVLTLALGIGACTAIFSVINAVLLRPLPYRDSNRLVRVYETDSEGPGNVSPQDFKDWRAQNKVFDHIAAFTSSSYTYTGGERGETFRGLRVTTDFFSVLQATPLYGRTFLPGDSEADAQPFVILSHGLWERRFGGDLKIIGQSLNFEDESMTVVGIMPPEFRSPRYETEEPELWANLIITPRMGRGGHWLHSIARLKPDVPLTQAQAEMTAIASALEKQYPNTNTGYGALLIPLHESMSGPARQALLVLLASVGFLLLIACANVANLMLARASGRAREIAIRTAMGASRWRLVRQLLTESLLLALMGGAAGLLLALWGIDILLSIMPTDLALPGLDLLGVDGRLLGFNATVSLFTGLLFGVVPSLLLSRSNPQQALKEGSHTATGTGSRLRAALVIGQVALALMLLVGSGLLIRSFDRLLSVDPGFNAENVLTLRLSLPRSRYERARQVGVFYQELSDKISDLPGVVSVGAVDRIPLGPSSSCDSFSLADRAPFTPDNEPCAESRTATPDYFRAMGARIVKGRSFTDADNAEGPPVVIINETMARQFWPGEDPLGKQFKWGDADEEPWRAVVGVIGDIRHFGLDEEILPEVYMPHQQYPFSREMFLALRTTADPSTLVAAVRTQVQAMDKNLPMEDVRPLEFYISDSVAQPRFRTILLGLFAALAALLAAVGLYGVISYSVSRRTHEIGIRQALGAGRRDIFKLIVGNGLALTLAGIGIGLIASFALTRFLSNLLFGVSATDPLTFAAVSIMLAAVAFAACYLPARRAMKVDPMEALRYE